MRYFEIHYKAKTLQIEVLHHNSSRKAICFNFIYTGTRYNADLNTKILIVTDKKHIINNL